MKNIVCIFSDDFRHELGGKHSLIGIYGDILNINGNQQVLPKLSATVYFHADVSDMDGVNHLSINIKLNGNVIAKNELPEKYLKESIEKTKENFGNIFSGVYNCNLLLVPIPEEHNTIEAEVMLNHEVAYVQKLTVNITKKQL